MFPHWNYLFIVVFVLAVPTASIVVRGGLLCGSHPAFNVVVRLWDEDHAGDRVHHLIAEEFTDREGKFVLSGQSDREDAKAVLKVYHDCDDGVKPGQRKFKFIIPARYLEEGSEDYEFGSFNLETRMKYKEEREREITRLRRVVRTEQRVDTRETQENIDNWSDESPEDRIEPW